MKKYEIDAALTTGYVPIDDQHKRLFAHLNNLLEATDQKKEIREMQKLILFLKNYIEEHLHDEEKLMEEWNYRNIESHKEEHERFRKGFESIISDYNDGRLDETSLRKRLESEIGDWFSNHISRIDRSAMEEIQKLQSASRQQ